MEITEVRIKLMEGSQDRLLGFCSITIDHSFVVRDLKIIRGGKGPFVAMPSRKLTDRCHRCGSKNHLRAAHCSQCGITLDNDRSIKCSDGRAKLYADIAHPINSQCRDLIQQRVLEAYEEEIILSQKPDYVCRYDDFGEDDYDPLETNGWEDESVSADSAPGRRHRIDAPGPRPSPLPHGEQADRREPATLAGRAQSAAGQRVRIERATFEDTASMGRDEFGEGLF
jgi:stage V sporulation protein G